MESSRFEKNGVYISYSLFSQYSLACEKEQDVSKFGEIAQDFHDATTPGGYNAFQALQDLFSSDAQKREVIEFLIAGYEEDDMEDRGFHFKRST